ncbi:hypothetical protein BAY61_26445 [Prauserella marina]|uniref:Uncharacterized protein n=1 Tax=Prauserella marina TaxID=530584 RepID=A0A222VVV9_9PSEU|nr:hypothetical protein [Prauserella marina]ASR37962.1 hypothetical protein BAY61_26445 [Prauserella marina]PWV73187.1 hypothetical protein DES30_109137 [Prauserella marina]SDD69824.1 hypothetical protein SAMN05421630_111136 [Prauserella marina]
MQISVLNRRAQQNYASFVAAMDQVAELFDEVDKLIDALDEKTAPGGFTVATPEELQALKGKAFDELDRMRVVARKYEGELISRDWRL